MENMILIDGIDNGVDWLGHCVSNMDEGMLERVCMIAYFHWSARNGEKFGKSDGGAAAIIASTLLFGSI